MTRPASPRVLGRFNRGLLRVLETILVLLVGALVADVLWQVVSRYVLRQPSSWTDELATLTIIWVALLGSTVALVREGHLGMDVLIARLAPGTRRHFEALAFALVALFALTVLLVGGLKLVFLTLQTGQVSPVLGLRMGFVYLVLPITGGCMASFAIEFGWRSWRNTGGTDTSGSQP